MSDSDDDLMADNVARLQHHTVSTFCIIFSDISLSRYTRVKTFLNLTNDLT